MGTYALEIPKSAGAQSRTELQVSTDRPALDEIEITPEMIEAGADVLAVRIGGLIGPGWSPDELASLVYRAMASLGSGTCPRQT